MNDKVPFKDWFNVSDNDALKCFLEFINKGTWPKFFIPADVDMSGDVKTDGLEKIARHYIEMKITPAIRARGSDK